MKQFMQTVTNIRYPSKNRAGIILPIQACTDPVFGVKYKNNSCKEFPTLATPQDIKLKLEVDGITG